MSEDGPVTTRPTPSKAPLLTIFVVLVVIGLTWRSCWYATPLSDAEIERLLEGDAPDNRIQKALSQLKGRADKKDGDVAKFWPGVEKLAAHRTPQIRSTAAWVMGAAPDHEGFGPVLERLLTDPAILVRYNAALSLAGHRIEHEGFETVEYLKTNVDPKNGGIPCYLVQCGGRSLTITVEFAIGKAHPCGVCYPTEYRTAERRGLLERLAQVTHACRTHCRIRARDIHRRRQSCAAQYVEAVSCRSCTNMLDVNVKTGDE